MWRELEHVVKRVIDVLVVPPAMDVEHAVECRVPEHDAPVQARAVDALERQLVPARGAAVDACASSARSQRRDLGGLSAVSPRRTAHVERVRVVEALCAIPPASDDKDVRSE